MTLDELCVLAASSKGARNEIAVLNILMRRVATCELMKNNMMVVLEATPANEDAADFATITPRGQAFIDHVLSLPLPKKVETWKVGE
jgi:hypothetical protein